MLLIDNELVSQLLTMDDCIRVQEEAFRQLPKAGAIKFIATIDPDAEALVYTPGSAFRTDVSGPGYWVFTPAKLADGATIVLNHGFIP